MIVVVGRPDAPSVRSLAGAIAARGVRCEVVGAASPDAAGDRSLRDLSILGAGHAAVLRTTASDLEPADLELALRYLPDARAVVLVAADLLVAPAAAAVAWSGATLVVVTGGEATAELMTGPSAARLEAPSARERTIVLAAPARDPDGAFSGLVADLAVRLDAGEGLPVAWPGTLATAGAETIRTAGSPAPEASPGQARTAAPARARRGSGRRS